jgi:hypothetical protein
MKCGKIYVLQEQDRKKRHFTIFLGYEKTTALCNTAEAEAEAAEAWWCSE